MRPLHAIAAALLTACAHAPCPPEDPLTVRVPLDAALRARIGAEPQAEVGVFVRTRQPPDDADLRALERAGLRIGTVAGDIASGRIRACEALRVAALDFVVAVELARDVPVPPSPSGRTRE
jgi:hypothetical protein